MAAQYVAANQLEPALQVYAARARAGEPCGEAGIAVIVDRRATSARELARGRAEAAAARAEDPAAPTDAGRSARARQAFLAALAADAGNPDAQAALAALDATAAPPPKPSATPLTTAQRLIVIRNLADAGFTAKAAEEAKALLATDPDAKLPDDLTYLADIRSPAKEIDRSAGSLGVLWGLVVGVITSFLLPLLTAGLLAYFARQLYRAVRRRRQERVDVRDLDDTAVGSELRLGKGLSGVIEEELDRLRTEGAGTGLSFVSAADPGIPIPAEVKTLVPAFAILEPVIALMPSKVTTITGTLLPAGVRGAGLVLSVVRPDGAIGVTKTFWEADYDPIWKAPKEASKDPSGYHRLAVVGAAWVLYQLAPETPGEERRRFEVVTSSATSYMTFRAGALWEETGDKVRARLVYIDALQDDPTNRGALHNLARLDATSEHIARWRRGRDRFREARTQIEIADRCAGVDPHDDRLWYRASYNLAATLFHLAIAPSDVTVEERRDAWRDAETEARQTIAAAARALKRLETTRATSLRPSSAPARHVSRRRTAQRGGIADGHDTARHPENAALRGFLAMVEASTAILLADRCSRANPAREPAGPSSAAGDHTQRDEPGDVLVDTQAGGERVAPAAGETAATTLPDALPAGAAGSASTTTTTGDAPSAITASGAAGPCGGASRPDLPSPCEAPTHPEPGANPYTRDDLRSFADRRAADKTADSARVATPWAVDEIAPARLVAYVLRDGRERVPSRARYNLACYFAGASVWGYALHELAVGLEGGTMTTWAKTDPSLRPLCVRCGREFDELIKNNPPPGLPAGDAATSALGELRAVKPWAAALAERGVTTVDDLWLRVRTDTDRATLGAELVVPTETVATWAAAVELASLGGVEAAHVNLLNAVRVWTVANLAAEAPEALATRLNERNATDKLVEGTLTAATVAGWIAQAGSIPAGSST